MRRGRGAGTGTRDEGRGTGELFNRERGRGTMEEGFVRPREGGGEPRPYNISYCYYLEAHVSALIATSWPLLLKQRCIHLAKAEADA